MAFNLKLPSEILTIVFQHLCPQDLVSCSHTCWTWNNAANPLLYETVSLSTCTMFQKFMECIIDPQNHDISCVENAIDRHQPLGQLVKNVDILVDISEYDALQNYSTMLSRLASKTSNIHTAKLYLPILCSDHGSRYSFDWSTLASQWTQLKSLTLRKAQYYEAHEYNLDNINTVLDKLQYLDVTHSVDILTYMRPSLPSMPYLQSFMANVFDTYEYQALKEILETCQDTLHTLSIGFYSYARPLSINLDDLKVGRKQLKAFGLVMGDDSQLHITNFGDNLEILEYHGLRSSNGYRSIIQAMKKTSKLKTLSLAISKVTLEDIPLVLENNKNTLRTFFIREWMTRGENDNDSLIPHLLAKNARFCNVTTLFIKCGTLKTSDVQSLAETFPSVEFLGLERMDMPSKRITTDDLSHFQHLKAIDGITYSEVIDQNKVTYQRCFFPNNLFWVLPSKKAIVF